jgi:large subunit ribosomal protein LP0
MSDNEQVEIKDGEGLTGKKLKKFLYRQKLNKMFDEYKNILIIGIDNVGSRQMQLVRIALRGTAVMLMGKNTMVRSVIRARKDPKLDALLPHVVMNVGFVFTNGSLNDVKKIIEENKVPAAAKAGTFAPTDVFVPPGPTGMDPGQTAFFQSLGIATKIERGNIAITSEVHLLKAGDKISASHVVLLQKMSILPFFYGIKVDKVYENGTVFDAAVLSLSKDDLLAKFMAGVAKIAALGFETGYPTIASVPFQMRYAFKKCIALSMECGYKFKLADDWLSGASAAAAPAAGAGAAKKEEKKVEEEEEESSSGGAIFGAMGGGDEGSEYEEE